MEATSSNEASIAQTQQFSQEREVFSWVSKEVSSGTVVRKELISWFAERVIQRDGSHEALAPDYVEAFLGRHPDLAKTLLVTPRPIPESLEPKKGNRLSGLDRLNAMTRKDRTKALYGDSPPPRRQPAPYPEGDIIYHCNSRYVVRHGDTITKYTVSASGEGVNDHPNEALALRFVKANTTIPVPEVVSSDWDRITMEYIEGQMLQQAWPVLTNDQRTNILDDLRGYIAQLHALSGIHIGRLDGQGAVLPSILPRSGGPFSTVAELHEWLIRPPKRLEEQSMYWHQITTQLGADYPIVFTHGDIAARNILVRDGRLVAILDWEFAGWYPAYWDYVFTLRGMDNIDWVTLGSQLPTLFPKRYDLEYILIIFVIRIS
ncbi:kinase-like domain-containing protein [Chaetomidium leptoderma]|uniref:non-specific serine/threonine protein kinase n=1 Tax=Chaetomidium leptoderma TaxID=669021 RepID=A0AAN6VNR6_9PEZI|nr:kinase-like domain-containing protein [Chaetomidium leptoderma]